MDNATKAPTKEQVRSWLHNEVARRRPPDAQQIRRELGWDAAQPAGNERPP